MVLVQGRGMTERQSVSNEAAAAPSVVLYTQPHCSACRSVERYLVGRGVPFEVRDVFADPVALEDIEGRGYLMTPVTRIGDEWIAGFHPRMFDRAFIELEQT